MIVQQDPVCYARDRVVFGPGAIKGVDYRAQYSVLAYSGDIDRCFGSWRDPAPVETRALVWRHSSKEWHDRIVGYKTEPTALLLLVVRQGDADICLGPNHEVILHQGGRLSVALLHKHASSINEHFGGIVHVHAHQHYTTEVVPSKPIRLTSAQAEILTAVQDDGERRYNGRATKQIEVLRNAGLVEAKYSFREVGPYGGRYVDVWTVRPVSNRKLVILPEKARRQKLKVYAWLNFRDGAGQTREIVAACSKAEVARLVGESSPRAVLDLHETENQTEVAVAMAHPGVIHWVSMRGKAFGRSSFDPKVWTASKK